MLFDDGHRYDEVVIDHYGKHSKDKYTASEKRVLATRWAGTAFRRAMESVHIAQVFAKLGYIGQDCHGEWQLFCACASSRAIRRRRGQRYDSLGGASFRATEWRRGQCTY